MMAASDPTVAPSSIMGMNMEHVFACPDRHKHILKMDEACLTIDNSASHHVALWIQSNECHKCSPWEYVTIPAGGTAHQVVNTTYISHLDLKGPNDTYICRVAKKFGEFGWYQLNVNSSPSLSYPCSVETSIQPANIYAPLLFVSAALLFLTLLVRLCHVLNDRMFFHWAIHTLGISSLLTRDLGDPDQSTTMISSRDQDLSPRTAALQRRIRSLDVFRGVAIVLMIFVNYRGGHYWMFRHAPWNGLTLADLVFPWFMWIMGASMLLSLRAQIRRSVPKSQLWMRMLRRCALLFLMGLTINSDSVRDNYESDTLRVPGVLQRLAVCGAIVASVLLPTLLPDEENQMQGRLSPIRDLKRVWGQWLVVLGLAAAHTLATFLLPVPGCGSGYLGPGGVAEYGRYSNCTGGAAGYLDRLVLGTHVYHRPTSQRIYNSTAYYDPEGILGTLTSCLAVYLGCAAARIIIMYPTSRERVLRFLIWSAALGLLAGALCGFSQNDGIIPVNKNLWSLSFVLATSCTAFLMFTLLYLLVDVCSVWGGRPFYYAGLNAILLYVGHELCADLFPISLRSVCPSPGTHLASLFLTLWSTLLWVLVAWRLYCAGVFIAL